MPELNRELKPCPFCGSQPKITTISNCYGGEGFSTVYEISCSQCKIGFRATTYFCMKDGEPIITINGYKECIDKWNRRADNET